MKNLILIRHAKSSWEAPLHDKDRPLTSQGMQSAHLVSSHITKALPKTFSVWSSTAERAVETAMIFAQNINFPLESIIYKDELYTFDERKLEKVIKSYSNGYDSIIIFGHNEAITNFVNKFGDVYIDNVPTAGFVHIEFNNDSWDTISKGKTKKILFPRDLK
ncbi:SixA phosphatase family protein [Flavobacterium taihuense]|uniref:Histidine phosphatase family protein n=1 Tax=Flavobacterium taihuense TaxID=2857508 RepID=A0ABS6Y002_9FLAO|nr:histidine phosphatase family protein [Flavobacterium taihuense]MBW4362249.1 histidine phosphatase family protein [Flavobacterium taihuense]